MNENDIFNEFIENFLEKKNPFNFHRQNIYCFGKSLEKFY